MRTLVFIAVAAMALNGCGFHLRGAGVLPPDIGSVYVDAPRGIADELEIFLDAGGVRRAAQRAQADAVISVHDEVYRRRVLSVDPGTGKEREFELSYRVNFGVTRTDGKILVAPQAVRLLRDYVFDADAVIGASREEGVLREEMRRDAVQQILRRLRAAL